MGSRCRISRTQFRSRYTPCQSQRMPLQVLLLTWSGDVDMKTGAPSSTLRNKGTMWFKKATYCWPWQYVSMLSRMSIAWASLTL